MVSKEEIRSSSKDITSRGQILWPGRRKPDLIKDAANISTAKLNPGLRYVNQAFGNATEPHDTKNDETGADFQLYIRLYDSLSIHNLSS